MFRCVLGQLKRAPPSASTLFTAENVELLGRYPIRSCGTYSLLQTNVSVVCKDALQVYRGGVTM